MPPTHNHDHGAALGDLSFWSNLISADGFTARRFCGGAWSQELIWLHNTSDFFIWLSYVLIPIVLVRFAYARRHELPFRHVFLLFGMFIILCGTTHFMEILMFYWPVYRLAGLIKFATAVISCATVAALVPIIPKALAMKSPDVLEAEVAARTAELRDANAAKDELLQSEQKARLDAEIARNEAEMAQRTAETANRAKDEFLMTLSHELRTPLNAIQGWASLLSSGKLDEETAMQAVETIERNAWTQTQLIADILEVSRIITGKMVLDLHPIDPAPIVTAALKAVEPAAQARNIVLESHLEGEPLLVSADSARMQQIVWNLLSNAIKFTPRGGKVSLALQRRDSFVEIMVKDTGEGIAPEFLPHVFDRFRQADSSDTRIHGGLGLGLAIVRHLTELHGGTVRAESPGLGQGATFIVSIPIRAVASQPELPRLGSERQARSTVNPHALSGLKILVVDDEEEARTLVNTILTLHGAQTFVTSGAEEALNKLTAWEPDVLISDIGMPGQNGYQLIENVRHSNQRSSRLPAAFQHSGIRSLEFT